MVKKSTKQERRKSLKPAKKKSPSSAKKSNTSGRNAKSRKAATSLRPRTASKKTRKTATSGRNNGSIVVRIMGHGQYRLDSTAAAKLNDIDNEIVKFVQSAPPEAGSGHDGMYQRFKKMLGEMTELVTHKGKQVPPSDIIPSDLILPPEDVSIEEARELFQGEGLIPG